MNRLFNDFFAPWAEDGNWFSGRSASFMPDIDIRETDKEYRVTIELPGVDEKDIDLSLLEFNQYSISPEAPQGSHFFRVQFLQTDTLIVTFRQTSWRGSWSASLTLISSPACGLSGTP